MNGPEVSLVILNWNSAATIFDCLDSLQGLRQPDAEVVVFDNGSTDGSVEELERRTDITLVRSDKNLGFAAGQLAALEHCHGRFLGLVNADAVVAADWLAVLLALLRSDDRVGAAGGRLYRWEGAVRSEVAYLAYHVIDPSTGEVQTLNSDDGAVRDVASLSAAAVLISRKAVESVGYFDPGFFAYYEETDLFARMLRAGFRIVYQPAARAWHRGAAGMGIHSYRYHYLMNRNRLRFAVRNFDRPYLMGMLRHWVRTETRIALRTPARPDIPHLARVSAAVANVAHLPGYLAARRHIVGRGSYNDALFGLRAMPATSSSSENIRRSPST